MSQEWVMGMCFCATHVGAEGLGPQRAIWGSEFDNYTEHCGHRHILYAAVKECVCVCVFVRATRICVSLVVYFHRNPS